MRIPDPIPVVGAVRKSETSEMDWNVMSYHIIQHVMPWKVNLLRWVSTLPKANLFDILWGNVICKGIGKTVESNSKSISTVALGSLIQEHVWVACQPAMSSIRTDPFMISFKSQSIEKYQSNGITSSSMDEKLLMNANLDDCIDVKTYRMALLLAQKILQHLGSWQIGYKKSKRFQLGFIPYITRQLLAQYLWLDEKKFKNLMTSKIPNHGPASPGHWWPMRINSISLASQPCPWRMACINFVNVTTSSHCHPRHETPSNIQRLRSPKLNISTLGFLNGSTPVEGHVDQPTHFFPGRLSSQAISRLKGLDADFHMVSGLL